MRWLTGSWPHLGLVAGKAVLMYATALLGLRLAERRTLAQWNIIDFVTAVAIGAIVGRTAVAGPQSFVTGAAALLTLLIVHRLASLARYQPAIRKALDHRIRVLVDAGELRHGELRRCGLTEDDIYANLRQRGVFDLAELRFLIYEAKGGLTIVRQDYSGRILLIEDALNSASGVRS
jgi:uncharacterized membrane protein YcaP (DUF421 family)